MLNRRTIHGRVAAALILCATLAAAPTPRIDYHQHLFSPSAMALVTGNPKAPGITAKDVVALLDDAGIQRALVLSVAYTWSKASRAPVENDYEHVKAENDWTAAQVAQYPDRLRAFCSVNPLRPYALEELARCSRIPQLQHGLKLHFGNSDVDFDNPVNVARVKEVFAAANGCHMAIVVHMHPSFDKQRHYGPRQARVFLNELLPAAPDVPVQIAHLAGGGDFETETEEALAVFIDAIQKGNRAMRNVWFDANVIMAREIATSRGEKIAQRIRELGVDRILYGSDAAMSALTYPRAVWAQFQRLPLTEAEVNVIANNVTPYMRGF